MGKVVVITRRKSLRCRVQTNTVTRTKGNTSSDWPFATLTRMGSFNGIGLSLACFTTYALMNECNALELSSEKWAVPFRTNGRERTHMREILLLLAGLAFQDPWQEMMISPPSECMELWVFLARFPQRIGIG